MQSDSGDGSADWSDGDQTSDDELRAAEVFASDDGASDSELSGSEPSGSSKRVGELPRHSSYTSLRYVLELLWRSAHTAHHLNELVLISASWQPCSPSHVSSPVSLRDGPMRGVTLHCTYPSDSRDLSAGLPTQKSAVIGKSPAAGDARTPARRSQPCAVTPASNAKAGQASEQATATAVDRTPASASTRAEPLIGSAAKAKAVVKAQAALEDIGSQETDAVRIREANIKAMLNNDVQLERQPVLPRYLQVQPLSMTT